MLLKLRNKALKKRIIISLILGIIGLSGTIVYYDEIMYCLYGAINYDVQELGDLESNYVELDMSTVKVAECYMVHIQDSYISGSKKNYYYIVSKKHRDGIRVFTIVVPENYKATFDDCQRKGLKGEKTESSRIVGKVYYTSEYIMAKMYEVLSAYGLSKQGGIKMEQGMIVIKTPDKVSQFCIICYILLLIYSIFSPLLLIIKYKIKSYNAKIKDMENDYEFSRFFSTELRIGDKYTFVLESFNEATIENRSILWVYECNSEDCEIEWVKSNALHDGIIIWDEGFEANYINISDRKQIDEILNYFIKKFPYIIVGYSKELEYLYLYDNENFKNIVFNKNSH